MSDRIGVGEQKQNHPLVQALRGQWDELLNRVLDWDVLERMAEQEGVAPQLYNAIRSGKNHLPIPDSVLSRLAHSYRLTQADNLLKLQVLDDVLARFNIADIPAVLLKGVALTELVYRDFGLRPMGDLDLFVRAEHVERAVAALMDQGYTFAGKPELRPGFDSEFRVEVELISPAPSSCLVEVHWHLIGPIFASRHVDCSGIWQRAMPVQIANRAVNLLGPEDLILHLSAHAVYKHREIRILNLCDLDQVIRHFEEQVDWERVLELGERSLWTPALAIMFAQCVDLFDTPIPPDVLRRAQAYRLPFPDRWLIPWWLKPGRPERFHIIPDWLTLPDLGARLRFLLAYLFPSREYIRAWNSARKGRVLPFLTL